MNIKLDTHAVRQLFPEGTEARAQLQQSVINNVVKEMVLKDSDNAVRKQVQAEKAVLSVIASYYKEHDELPASRSTLKASLTKAYNKSYSTLNEEVAKRLGVPYDNRLKGHPLFYTVLGEILEEIEC